MDLTVVAVAATGLFVALAVAALAGQLPQLRPRARRSAPSRLATRLAEAGLEWPPAAVRGGTALAAAVTVLLVVQATGIPGLALVPAVLVAVAPGVWLRRRAARRQREVRQAWPDALAQLGGSVRAGRPLSHALVDISLSGPVALREPMAGLATRIQTVGLVPALEALADVVADPVTDRVVEVLCLAHAEGSAVVVDVVDDLAASIAEEVHAAEEVDTLALEGRLNARLVFALPWVVLVLLTARPGPFADFYARPAGGAVILVGAVVSLIGIAVVARLSAMPSEPRVLHEEAR